MSALIVMAGSDPPVTYLLPHLDPGEAADIVASSMREPPAMIHVGLDVYINPFQVQRVGPVGSET